ncbi:MAG: hypothetical protein ACRDJW_07015 [Thermomicrobiales bacterium]
MAIHRHRWVSALLVVMTVLATGATSLAQDETGGPEPGASPAATPATVAFESQVFAMSPWRFTLVSARFGDAIPEVELSARTGRDWAVVVFDVLNWSEEDADLRWRDFGLRMAGELEGGGFAPQTSEDVADALGVEPGDASDELTIDAAETVRAAMVFQVDDGGRDPALALNGLALPLAGALAGSPPPDALPPVTEAPELESERVVRVADGRTIRVGGGTGRPVRLAGVDAPAPEECFGAQSTERLEAMAGEEVLIERVAEDEDGFAYIWVDAPDGTRRLLNFEIIATGNAAAGDSDAPRVRAWLAEAEYLARYSHLGLWFGCSGPHGVARPEEPESTELELDVEGIAGEYEVWTAWAPEIVATPDGGAVAFFSAAPVEEEVRGDLRLYWSRFDPTTGRWSRARPIPGGRVQMGPSAIVDLEGRVHVAFSDRRADEADEPSRLRYVTEDGNGDWTDPIDLAPERAAGHQLSPSLTIDDTGVLHAAWQDQREWRPSERIASNSNADIFASSLTPGGTWSDPVLVSVHAAGQVGIRPKIVADGDRLVAVWSVYTTDLGLNFAARVEWSTRSLSDPEATWNTPETLIAGRGESFGGRLIDLSADPTGGVVLVFGRQANDAFLFVRRLEAAAETWGSDILITYGQRGAFPSVAVNELGTTYVVYNLGVGALVDVGATAIAHGSVDPGPEVNLTANEPETQGLPAVTVDNTGAPWIIYFNQTSDGVANAAKTLRAPVTPLD